MTFNPKIWVNGQTLDATGLIDLETRLSAYTDIIGGGSAATGTTYYIDNAGNDSSNGLTVTTAWATVSKINGFTFAAGDKILFKRGGAWRTSTLVVPRSDITFGAYGVGRDPIISGGTLVTGWSATSGGTYSASLATLAGAPPMVTYTVANITTVLAQGSGSGSLGSNQYYHTGGLLYVNLGDTVAPTGQVEVAARQIVTSSAKANLTFKNLDFRHGHDAGLVIQDATGHLFDSCAFKYITYNNSYAGALNWTHGGSGSGRITNCVFDWLANDGIYTTNTKNIEIDHCTMTNVGGMAGDQQSDGIQVENYSGSGLNSDGLWIHDNYISMGATTPKGGILVNTAPSLGASATAIVERNTVIGGNFGIGAHSPNLVVRNNTISGQTATDASAIWIDPAEVFTGMVFTYNLIYNCYFGINGGGGSNSRQVTVAHNTLVDCSRAFILFQGPVYGIIKNNILWSVGAAAALRVLYVLSVTGGQTISIDYNAYPAAFTNYLYLGGVYEASTFAAWLANTTMDDNTSNNVDPLFVSAANRDYTLQSGSPCVNAATIIPNIGQVILGAAPDKGYAEKA